jgi:hypothetical protein
MNLLRNVVLEVCVALYTTAAAAAVAAVLLLPLLLLAVLYSSPRWDCCSCVTLCQRSTTRHFLASVALI